MDPKVKSYLTAKYGIPLKEEEELPDTKLDMPGTTMEFGPVEQANPLDAYTPEKFAAAEARSKERQSGLGGWQALAGLGDAIAGRSPSESAKNFDNMRTRIQDEEVGALDRNKKAAMDRVGMEKLDPSSKVSVSARKVYGNILAKSGFDPSDIENMSANDVDEFVKGPLEFKMRQDTIKAQTAATAAARAESRATKDLIKEEKDDRYRQERETPYGLARTPDDAKQLKEAAEMKAGFDRKLDELIALRKSKGAEAFDREAVGRAKQLSKDLLLAYKDMSKLGVLSKSDENILNEIIPSDPLQWNASSLMGQDPTMVKMEKFREDSNTDFNTRLRNRLRDPSSVPEAATKQVNPERAATVRMQAPDGSVREVPADQVKKYEAKGGKRV